MEFDIKVKHGVNGEVEIIDLSRDCGAYIEEEAEFIPYIDQYKYSHCSSINILTKVNSEETELIDAFVTEHVENPENNHGYKYPLLDDVASFKLNQDGYYQVIHLVLPNKTWIEEAIAFNNGNEDFIEEDGFLLYCIIDNKLKKYIKGKYLDASIAELVMDINPAITNLQKVSINLFYLGYLKECYLNYCKSYFDKSLKLCNNRCKSENSSEDLYARDFLHTTLNVIKYLVEFEKYLEALRILEQINHCGGFCNNVNNKNSNSCGCGCNTKPLGCGCNKA